ncbi:MAG: outer membrane protein OmpA-like peptidoglycan-associated protein [Patiriisocius sp.]|jgi:outer membrane protein OmpA-like peptidoglycan-associated protein
MIKAIQIFIVVSMLLLGSSMKAQVESGNIAMAEFDYELALEYYSNAHENNVQTPYLLRKIAKTYYMLGDFSESKKWYKKLVHIDATNPEDMLYLAEGYKYDGDYENAMKYYKRFNAKVPGDRRGVSHTMDDSLFFHLKADSMFFEITRLSMNTPKPEFGLTPYKDGTFLFSAAGVANPEFSRRNNKEVENPYLDVFKVNKTGEFELTIVDFVGGWINTPYHDGPVSYSPSYNEMFITRNNIFEDEPVRDSQGRINLKILSSFELGGEWSDPLDLPFNNSEYSCAQPAISANGNMLYFTSNMPSSLGKTDIYYSKRNDEGWSEPVNLGSIINTEGDEAFPFIDDKGDLYFASTGHAGLGGFDMFKSEFIEGKWTTPVNLKYPINSRKDDISIMPENSDRIGYISSNRESLTGDDDIYFYKKIADFIANIYVHDKFTGKPVDAVNIVLLDTETKELIFDGTTDEEGKINISLMEGKDYEISFSKPGWFLGAQNLSTKDRNPGVINVHEYMEKMERGKSYVINNVYFDYNKWDIRPDAAEQLDKIVKILNDNPSLKIELAAHTDCRGSAGYNEKLSDKRAKSSAAYIVSQGIFVDRITGVGYGEKKLINECECEGKRTVPCTEDQHQENRRTEFTIIDF